MNNNDNKRCRIDYIVHNYSCNNNNDNNQNQNEILLKRKANNNRSQIENNYLQNQNIELNNNINILKDTLINNNIIVTLNTNSNNINYNNSDNNNIYNKVFNNIYIRRIIFNHLNKFNILYPLNFQFRSSKEFKEFKYKEYLHRVTLDFENDQFELNQLPHNIKHLTFNSSNVKKNGNYEIISVPDHIESVSHNYSGEANYFNSLPHSSKIKTLNIFCLEKEILPNQIPSSVTDLIIYTKRLSNNVLPSNLKKLAIERLESFEDNCFQIESLTHIRIRFSTLLIFHQLSRSFFKNLVKLELVYLSEIDSNIQFPNNLKELIIECNSFNYKSSNKQKSQQSSTDEYHPILFPSSLEKLWIFKYGNPKIDSNIQFLNNLKELTIRCDSFIHLETLPPNLKSLSISLSSIVDDKGQSILPSKLEKFNINGSFNQELQVNQLPSTLTHLDLGNSFNKVINVNVLPENLNILKLGREYSQIINPLAIPQQLNLLQIFHYDYSHSINLTPLTHPNTAISLDTDNINLYYQATSSDYNQIRVLRLPDRFRSPLSTLQLQNKSNLEYLHLGSSFNDPIKLSDLPTKNNIKTLELGTLSLFNQIINLEHFQNLETLILVEDSNPTIITTTTTIIDEQQIHHLHYNNYKLKNITVSPKNIKFLKQLDINFYQFIKYNK